MKQIKVHNPGNLPVRPYQELHDFQDDFKHEIEPEALKKLKNSLIRHGVFVPKFVWLDGEKACIIDGHQTRKALESLEAEGYTIPPIPYVEIQAESRADAAEKLLQINSRYAKINPESDFLRDLENAKEMLERIEIPEINIELLEIPTIDGDGDVQNGIEDPGELKLSALIELNEKWQIKQGDIYIAGGHVVACGDSTDTNFIDRLMAVSGKPDHLIYDPDWDSGVIFPEFEWQGTIAYCDGFRAKDVISKFGAPLWIFAWDGCTSWYTPNRPLRRAKFALWFGGDVGDYNFDGAHYGDPGIESDVTNSRGSYHYVPDPRGKHLSDVFQKPLTKLHSDGFHPYEKPMEWVKMLIGNCFPGKTVCDPFVGCGNTVFACDSLGKSCVCVDINPLYIAFILEQIEKTGKTIEKLKE